MGLRRPRRAMPPEDQAFRSRYVEADRFAADLVVPLIGHDRVIGAVSAVTQRAAPLDRRRHRVRARARDPRLDRDQQRRPVRAGVDPGRPDERAPGRLGPDEPPELDRVGRPGRRRGDAPDHRLPQRPGLRPRGARQAPCRSRSRAPSGRTRRSTWPCSRPGSVSGSPAGPPSTARRSSSRTPTPTRAGSTIPGTDEVDESMLVVPMRYDERVTGAITLSKLGLNQFHDRGPGRPHDPRRPGCDRDRVRPPARPRPGASPASCAASST